MFNDTNTIETNTIEPDERAQRSMRLFVTGGSGVLGRALQPLAQAAGHQLHAPSPSELDLFDPIAVASAMRGVDAVFHLATRIRPLDQLDHPEAWRENDRLRAEASAILVDAARGRCDRVHPADGHLRLPGRSLGE